LYLLISVDVSVARKWIFQVARIVESGCRKSGCLGVYKKSIFRLREKDGFFADFVKRVRTLVLINEHGRLVYVMFFIFLLIGVENTFKKNIVSNLRWITDLNLDHGRIEA